MAVLDQLTLSDAAPKRDTTPLGRFRRRVIEAIDLQVAMAEADAAGAEFRRTRKRWIKNDAGVKELREIPLRSRRSWWQDETGMTYLSLRSSGRVLEFSPGKTAIEIGGLAELPGKLAILRSAVRAGELDGSMVDAPPRGFKKSSKAEGQASTPTAPKKASRKPEEGARPSA